MLASEGVGDEDKRAFADSGQSNTSGGLIRECFRTSSRAALIGDFNKSILVESSIAVQSSLSNELTVSRAFLVRDPLSRRFRLLNA